MYESVAFFYEPSSIESAKAVTVQVPETPVPVLLRCLRWRFLCPTATYQLIKMDSYFSCRIERQ